MVNKAVMAGIGIIAVVGIVMAILYGMYISGFNGAQGKDENVKRLSADVDTQLQRRYDLIPNLVESVRGYMQFERQTLEDVTRLRSQWMATSDTASKVETSNQIEQALSKILLTYEAYPELKTDSTVTRLMDELAGTENRIAVARTYYNDGVRDFNTNLRVFPNNVFNESGFIGMSPWGLEPYPQFEATASASTVVPSVNLTG